MKPQTEDINTDQRNFIDEAVEEMLDTINYLVYEILRLRKLKS